MKKDEEVPCPGEDVCMYVCIVNSYGRSQHEVVLIYQACNKCNRQKPKDICVELPGEIIKI